MPQLSTTHILLIYTWTWFILFTITQKTKMILINKTPTKLLQDKIKKTTPPTPWT